MQCVQGKSRTQISRCWADPPRAHGKVPHLSNPHYSFAKKKKLFWKKQNQNNSCPFCNNLLNSTCQTRGNYLPRYKRHQALYSLTVACVTVRLLYTISILWGPAGHVNAPPTWLQLVSPTQSPKTLVWGASAESLNAITGQGVKFSLS